MNAQAQQILIAFLAICSPFVLSFLIVAILSPRYKVLSERNGWTVQPHPEDHRDHLFRGRQNGIKWEMECYINEHYQYRGFRGRYIPFTNVIVWTSNSITLPRNTLLIYPRRDKLKHFVHPRLSLEKDTDLVANQETEKLERFLFHLPEKAIGSAEFQQWLVVRTDLEVLPDYLINRLHIELFEWKKIQIAGPVIVMNSRGVTIWWIPIGMRNEWLEKTVTLGTSLADTR